MFYLEEMKIKQRKYGFTAVEFFLSTIALFLLLIITFPILQELTERKQIGQIKENLNKIQDYAEQYFEEQNADSVSIYEFIGPRKVIPELEIIADEEYPETIFRDKQISVYSKRYGMLSVQ